MWGTLSYPALEWLTPSSRSALSSCQRVSPKPQRCHSPCVSVMTFLSRPLLWSQQRSHDEQGHRWHWQHTHACIEHHADPFEDRLCAEVPFRAAVLSCLNTRNYPMCHHHLPAKELPLMRVCVRACVRECVCVCVCVTPTNWQCMPVHSNSLKQTPCMCTWIHRICIDSVPLRVSLPWNTVNRSQMIPTVYPCAGEIRIILICFPGIISYDMLHTDL